MYAVAVGPSVAPTGDFICLPVILEDFDTPLHSLRTYIFYVDPTGSGMVVVGTQVMLGRVVGKIFSSRGPVDVELPLFVSVP